ncbi:MAG: hypothetical protein QXJ97_10335 [Desulfurococcaceae archaeon]
MSRWRGTRLCEPLFADGSGEHSDPLEPQAGRKGINRWDESVSRKTKNSQKNLANGHGQPLSTSCLVRFPSDIEVNS